MLSCVARLVWFGLSGRLPNIEEGISQALRVPGNETTRRAGARAARAQAAGRLAAWAMRSHGEFAAYAARAGGARAGGPTARWPRGG